MPVALPLTVREALEDNMPVTHTMCSIHLRTTTCEPLGDRQDETLIGGIRSDAFINTAHSSPRFRSVEGMYLGYMG